MLKIEYYEDEIKKHDGYLYHCASINTDSCNCYTSIDTIESRCGSYEDAKKEVLKHVKALRDELNDLLKKEGI